MNSKETIINFLNLFTSVKINLGVITLNKISACKKLTYKSTESGEERFVAWIHDPDGPITYMVSAESHDSRSFFDINSAVDYFIHLSEV